MANPRYKPTFALQCVVLACVLLSAVGLLSVVYKLGNGLAFEIALGIFFALIFFANLFSAIITKILARRMERNKKHPSAFWFIDLEKIKRQEEQQFFKNTKDNPTLR